MNLGIVLPGLGFAGGVERYASNLAVSLRGRGHRVVLLHGPRRGHAPSAFAEAFDDIVPVEHAGAAGALDVVYAQKVADTRALAPLSGVPLLLAAHDHDHTCARSHRYLPLGHAPCHRAPGVGCALRGCALVSLPDGSRRRLSLVNPLDLRRRTLELAALGRFVACSRYVAARLVDAGVPERRVVVIHPVPPEDPATLVPRPRAPKLLFVGQLVRGKGVELALDALAQLPRDATLDVVGDGPSRVSLEARAASLSGRVRFHGWKAPGEVTPFYDAASVVVVPSLWPEPFGMIGVEAMRRARPVVGTAHGGIPEWMPDGHGGLLVPPGDAGALARAALALHADRGAGEEARAHALARFPHERFVAAMERALARAADGSDAAGLKEDTSPPS